MKNTKVKTATNEQVIEYCELMGIDFTETENYVEAETELNELLLQYPKASISEIIELNN